MITLAKVLDDLTLLTPQERRELPLRLLELECTGPEAEDLAACEQAAALGFAMLDELEAISCAGSGY